MLKYFQRFFELLFGTKIGYISKVVIEDKIIKIMKFFVSAAIFLGAGLLANADKYPGWQDDPESDYKCAIAYEDNNGG